MPRFRKRPVEVDAIYWTGENWCDIDSFLGADADRCWQNIGQRTIEIPTVEGLILARPGDWIIRDVFGDLNACRDDIFKAGYDEM